MLSSSKMTLESLKLSETKDEKEKQNKNVKKTFKRQMTIQTENSEKTLKRRESLTSSVKQIKNSQIERRRVSYSDLFLLKLNYVSNDINLSQKHESGYSNLYKNGIRVFDDLEKENSKSLKSSFTLPNSISKASINKKYMRTSSLQPNFFRNKNFNLLNCSDDAFGIKNNKSNEYIRNDKKKRKKKNENNSSDNENNNSNN